MQAMAAGTRYATSGAVRKKAPMPMNVAPSPTRSSVES